MELLSEDMLHAFLAGQVIPALPLALTEQRRLDERRQRAVIRYYIDAGAGGIAVGVHSTQFEIRNPAHGLFLPLLRLASETIDGWSTRKEHAPMKIAGVIGGREQALAEARAAADLGYHAALLSLGGFDRTTNHELLDHCRAVSAVLPLIGFYLQPAVGGRILDLGFWRGFAEIENVIGVKIAPFNRYRTLDVVRAVCEVGREREMALYTGNDDNILIDLLTPYQIRTESGIRTVRIVGGLLGQWGVWTERAVELLRQVRQLVSEDRPLPQALLGRAVEITDANAAIFDAAHEFAGVIPGIHEILRRQGLFAGTWCLDPHLSLSPGQAEEIDRVYRDYPDLNDDAFVRENLDRWLAD